jgi:glycosyltransferase involved in cell wall biosynthesis
MAIPGSSAELSEQMRLLLVNYEYPPVGAGAATATRAIAHNLVALGHSVTVLTGSFRGLPHRSQENGVTVLRVRCLRRRADRCSVFEMLSFTLSALLSLPSVRAATQPDALIVFFSFPTGPVGALARSWYGLPYLVSLRGGDVPGLTPEVNWIHRLLAPIRRHILKHATAVVANAEGLRKLSEATDPTCVRVIPNGVDTEFFQPSITRWEDTTPGHPFRLLFVGRFQGQKNLPYFLKECSRLPAGSFELHLVGDGPLAAELRALAEQLGLASAVIWHGWLPRVALRDIYQSVDCFINPSLYEGMPNVVLEAMACALPVIASNIPGNDDLVSHGKTGLLFDLQNPSELASHLRALANDRALGQRMGRAARIVAETDYSWRNVAQRYAALFDSPQPNLSTTT